VPHFSSFSTLPPRSATTCSSVVTILLTSSSGVSGRQIKTRSYNLSSMVPLGSLKPRTSIFFFSRRHALVVPVHRAMHALGQNRLHGLRCFVHHPGGHFQFGFAHWMEHVRGQVAHWVVRLHAQPHTDELVRAQRADQRLQPVM